jgi:hypothetical protein
VNVNDAVPDDVPPRGTAPADVTLTAPNASGAATVAKRAESKVALNAMLAPFLRMFKGFDPPKG